MMLVPRRLDVDHLADGFALRVFVNGERQTFVRFYDIDDGYIERIMTNGHGAILTIGGEAIRQTVIGKVQVEIFEAAPCQR